TWSCQSYLYLKATSLAELLDSQRSASLQAAARDDKDCWYLNEYMVFATASTNIGGTNAFADFYHSVFLREIRTCLNYGIPGTEIGNVSWLGGKVISHDTIAVHVRSMLRPA